MKIGKRTFQVAESAYVMGILNVTPDSFSDGGKFISTESALRQAEKMVDEGADIIDVGGESTRPGYQKISDEEEIQRTAHIIELIKTRFDIPVSIDTYKGKVALAALQAGADLVNDIWGLKYDRNLAKVIAEAGVPCCLMHNREQAVYYNFIEDVKSDLRESLEIAGEAGIAQDKIILDPGVGFGKTYEHNLQIIYKLKELKTFGCPVLLGASRKSVVGIALDLPVEERLEGTLAITVLGVMAGCAFVRVHDVLANKRAIQMAEAVREGWKG
ncbi:MAG: dihydropteroate synthase [Lachnospiraceae bacterium]|nr:dihydropteroate synthase [Lachnospiraceae bacterium]